MPTPRRTLRAATAPLSGRGLFSGQPSTITIHPSLAATGILFTPPGRGPVQATPARVIDWQPKPWTQPVRNTSIGLGKPPSWSLGTIEHLMSALAGLGITDAVIEVNGPEVPILDGSALPFVQALEGLATDTDRTADPITLRHAVEVTNVAGALIRAIPRGVPGCSLRYELNYPGTALPPQTAQWDGTAAQYLTSIAPARTFSMRAEAEDARAVGLFKHFTPADMLVIGDDGLPIDNAFRLPDEPAHHKLLDLIGDLALLDRPLQADIVATHSGHRLTHQFCRDILAHLA